MAVLLRFSREPSCRHLFCASRCTFRRFFIQGLRDRCGTALVAKLTHADRTLQCAEMELQLIADAQILRRLHALAVQPDFAAFKRLLRQGTRLVESCRPQPLIDTHGARYAGIGFCDSSASQPRAMR